MPRFVLKERYLPTAQDVVDLIQSKWPEKTARDCYVVVRLALYIKFALALIVKQQIAQR